MSNYRTSAAGRAAAKADQAHGDVAGEGGRDAAEMDVVEEAGEGAGAAVAADQPPPCGWRWNGGGGGGNGRCWCSSCSGPAPLWLEVVEWRRRRQSK